MLKPRGRRVAYILALLTSLVWGTTFAASGHALSHGIGVFSLTLMRFVAAYAILWVLCRQFPRPVWQDELVFAGLGLTGGSLYFILEYSALRHAPSADVGIIVSTVPIVTTALIFIFSRRLPGWRWALGTLLATVGVVVVVGGPVGGRQGELIGYLFALGATVAWALYTLLLVRLKGSYSPLLVSRRLFFYATLTLVPMGLISDHDGWMFEPDGVGALGCAAYLGVVASGLCVWTWNVVVNELGAVRANTFLYLLTVVPVGAALLFGQSVGLTSIVAALVILMGVALADSDRKI